ncbi:orotidine-5'-phosphate decarboxylase [Neisseria sp. Ec49-e6-T10]|uniref:orotidine-5'-phosphate decarboxylase n=1 Tax=Neisseria sp. Ec49-e6-T10 TaxID=3140744 RepID=UPI003EBC1965
MNPIMFTSPATTEQTKPVIVALDFDNAEDSIRFASRLNPQLCQLKIGKELFTASGRSLAETLINKGFRLFLDLKYHDIPNTVAKACKVAAQMGVWMVDLHTLGGSRMMHAAREAIEPFSNRPLLIGVTILTSMEQSDLLELGINKTPEKMVLDLASLAQKSGLDGVVCSAQEASVLKEQLGQNFVLVTPGIRLDLNTQDDQRRIMTPKEALQAGAHYLVMGRPITQASDPVAVLKEINMLQKGGNNL